MKKGLKAFQYRAAQFQRLRRPDDLAALLGFTTHSLQLRAAQPKYHHFSIPKKDGSKRWLEDPNRVLKAMQDQLNTYLQSCYWFVKTDAAYGFVDNPKGYPQPRHIHSNAEQHLGRPWLLNADLEDFFHSVTEQQVLRVFQEKPFSFRDELAHLLTSLCTYLGRLPMGAPTSPVLSNLAVVQLDHDLLALAASEGWTFTRYADDMSFSSAREIDVEHFSKIANLVSHYGYRFNEQKVWYYGPGDTKKVTGLVLGKNGLELPPEFTAGMEKEIGILANVVQANFHFGHKRSTWVEKYQQRIEGMLNFAGLTLGEHDPDFQRLSKAYFEALEPDDEHDSLSWMDFPYL